MRWMLAVAGVFVLAGCGSGVPGQAGGPPITADQPAPPILAANESPPDDIAWVLKMDFQQDLTPPSGTGQGVYEICSRQDQPDKSSVPDPNSVLVMTQCPQPSPEEIAKLQAQEEAYVKAIQPSPGSDPQVVAKLELGGGSELLFTTWTTTSGAVCWEVDEEGADTGGASGPSGPCTGVAQLAAPNGFTGKLDEPTPCTDLCVDSTTLDDDHYALEGTVPADAQALRVTVAGGGTATYPLVGPRLPDARLRVFMVDLGAHDWRKVELIRDGAAASAITMPPLQANYEDCSDQVGPPPVFTPTANPDDDLSAMTTVMKPYEDALQACITAKSPNK